MSKQASPSARVYVQKRDKNTRVFTLLFLLVAAAIIAVWASRDDSARAQGCTFNSATNKWTNCAPPLPAVLTDSDPTWEERACLYLYDDEDEGAFYTEAQAFLSRHIGIISEVDASEGYDFVELQREPFTWAFKTESGAFPVDWAWEDASSASRLLDNLEQMEAHFLALHARGHLPHTAAVAATLDRLENQQALLRQLIPPQRPSVLHVRNN